jgi:hypothetical protein
VRFSSLNVKEKKNAKSGNIKLNDDLQGHERYGA